MRLSEESFAWVTLTRTPALDVRSLNQALHIFGTAHDLVSASAASRARAGLPRAACEFLSSAAARLNRAERAWLEDPRHHVVPISDRHYPSLLREARRHPIALYVAGNVDVLNEPQLGMVGSRHPTPQGRAIAQDFAQSLAARGLAITSGLAAGIDTAAHRGALLAQGVTLAVQGSGLDIVYPRCNTPMSLEIQHRGALLSRFPLGTPPRAENFPQRNGIIAGLSLGALVVEAARRSGSLITARLAAGLGRGLFAVPGSIHSPVSRGCHDLIREGAKLTETAHDILSELGFSASFARGTEPLFGTCRRAHRSIGNGQGSQNLVRCARL